MYPNINLINPDINIQVLLINNRINIMLYLSGYSLHQRWYRKCFNITSLQEKLSAAIILSSTWKKIFF
ncbi:hypothetical protein [Buchnera aphidicola]|uniref:hypothetical protein n=1 Tax=Buchnera aphidicola TaxID=9 RepID=UPI000A423B38|nr:hypothetical protein [Buchnera aphidicola]